MKQYISGHTIANQIRMGHKAHGKVYGIVEGHTDIAFYRYFFDLSACQLILAEGKSNAVASLQILKDFQPVFALLDADFWPITGKNPSLSNIFMTDTHDAETLIIRSEAFAKTLNNFANLDRLDRFLAKLRERDMRNVLLFSGKMIGCLRLLNETQNYGLNFQSLRFEDFTDTATLKVNLSSLVDKLLAGTGSHRVSKAQLLTEAAQIQGRCADEWLLVCGHDLVSLLVVGLRNTFGFRRNYVEPEIEAGLRQAFEKTHFCQTRLHAAVKTWSETRLGRKILAC